MQQQNVEVVGPQPPQAVVDARKNVLFRPVELLPLEAQAALRLQDKVFARRARLCERVAEAGLGLAELIAGGVVEEVDLQFQGRPDHDLRLIDGQRRHPHASQNDR